MPLFDLNSIKKGLQQTAEGLKKTVANASEKVTDSLKPDKLNDTVKSISQLSQDTFDSLRSKGEETWNAIVEKKEKSDKAVSEALKTSRQAEPVLAIRDALRVIYGLIAVDGIISQEEKEKFNEIGNELDPSFSAYSNALVAECTAVFEKPSEDDEDYYDTIHDYLGTIIHKEIAPTDGAIRGKLLLWDMLTIAQSDGEYSTNEKRLIRYMAKSMGVESAIPLEMEQTIRTLVAIENEEKWLKNSDRPYTVIEARINELSDRKAFIITAARALISD